jgi:mono/diheme cytochrome c family protein
MRMKHRALPFVMPLLLLLPQAASAENLNDQQREGQRLFDQSCVVCHMKPQITSGQFGPVLSKETLGGKDNVIREVISNGSPHMPGFKIQFQPNQIDAVIAYLKTIPAPAAPAKSAGKKAGGNPNDD